MIGVISSDRSCNNNSCIVTNIIFRATDIIIIIIIIMICDCSLPLHGC